MPKAYSPGPWIFLTFNSGADLFNPITSDFYSLPEHLSVSIGEHMGNEWGLGWGLRLCDDFLLLGHSTFRHKAVLCVCFDVIEGSQQCVPAPLSDGRVGVLICALVDPCESVQRVLVGLARQLLLSRCCLFACSPVVV